MPASCSNCNGVSVENYCATCGQRADASLRPFWAWITELADTVIDIDQRGLRTLRMLLFRPGEPTRRYAAGQRVYLTPPLRLYLVTSAIVITIMSFSGFFESPAVTGINDPEIARRFELLFPLINLFSPLVLLLWLKLLFPKRMLQLHLVMALHVCTFIVIATSPILLLLAYPEWLPVGQLVGVPVMAAYCILAIRHAYSCGWIRATTSGLLVTVAFFVSLAFLQLGVFRVIA